MTSTKNAPDMSGNSVEGDDQNLGKEPIMKDVISVPQATDIAARFEQIRAEVETVLRRRDEIFITSHAELIASGVQSHVVTNWCGDPQPGDMVTFWEKYSGGPNRYWIRRDIMPRWSDHLQENDDRYGPYVYGGTTHICRGVFQVLIRDNDKVLIVDAGEDTEEGHRRAVARLRSRARSEHFRVSVRGRGVTLISPMNDIVHEGDVNSAHLWLDGIDVREFEATS